MIWKLCEAEKAKGYVSALTFANLVHIMRKEFTPKRIEETLDALQSVTAERIRADYIITRNIKDFAGSKVIAFTPSELIARI